MTYLISGSIRNLRKRFNFISRLILKILDFLEWCIEIVMGSQVKNFRSNIISGKSNEKYFENIQNILILYPVFYIQEQENYPRGFKYQNDLILCKSSEKTDRQMDGLTDRQQWFHWILLLQWSKMLDVNWSRPDIVNINSEHIKHSIQKIHSIVSSCPQGWKETWVQSCKRGPFLKFS